MRKQNQGFTLAELLIVVAIIAVLVAVSIPIFNNQIRKARLATNQANARAAYAAYTAGYLSEELAGTGYFTYDISTGKVRQEGPRNYGAYVGKDGPHNMDISSWTTETRTNKHLPLGNYVFKNWQMQVQDGVIITYYGFLDSSDRAN